MSDAPRAKVKRTLSDLLPRFMENRRGDLIGIETALGQSDYVAIARVGHRLKGAGGGYGFVEITDIGQELEIAARNMDRTTVNRLMGKLGDYLDNVQIEFI